MMLRVLIRHTPLSAPPKSLSTGPPRWKKEARKAILQEKGLSGGRKTDRGSFQEASLLEFPYIIEHWDHPSVLIEPLLPLVLSCFYHQGSKSWDSVNFNVNSTPENETNWPLLIPLSGLPASVSASVEGSLCPVISPVKNNSWKFMKVNCNNQQLWPPQSLPDFPHSPGCFLSTFCNSIIILKNYVFFVAVVWKEH